MKKFLLLILCAALLLLSGCGYSEEELTAATNLAYAEGYDAGKTAGIEEGYSNGYAKGEANGYSEGMEIGREAAYEEGYDEGYNYGYNGGYDDGYIAGKDNDNSLSFDLGSDSGLTNWNATVYVSRSGIIHSNSSCSGMKHFTRMSLSDALDKGYDKCSNCY